MNPRIENLRGYILRKEHHVLRRTPARLGLDNLNIGFAAAGMPPVRRSAEMLAALMRAEQPVILPGEKIVFTRTVTEVPEIFTPQEWDGIKASHYIHERGTVCNISPDYETTIRLGLDARKAEIASRLADDSLDQEQRIFLGSVALCIEAVQELTGRYAAHAREAGQADTAQVLEAVRTRAPGRCARRCNCCASSISRSGRPAITTIRWGVSTSTCTPISAMTSTAVC